MSGCYAMGNFADNFYKQAIILMAIGQSSIQSRATVLFALPFVLFSAWAGWLADRLPKRDVVLGVKVVELAIIGFGAIAIWQQWWSGILAVVFLMASLSTVFAPAINGAIPESFARHDVPRVNGIIRSISTAAVLAGIALAGPLLETRPESFLFSLGSISGPEYGRLLSGIFVVFISAIGLSLALSIKKQPTPSQKHQAFPWAGPIDSLRHVIQCRKDKALFTVMSGDAFFYGLAPIVVISIANLAKSLGYSDSLASVLSAALMAGIVIGALIGGRQTPDSWRKFMVPSLLGLAFFLFLAGCTPSIPQDFQLLWFSFSLLSSGICGGIYIIPIASFLQVHPKDHEKGKVLAASNFYSFLSMAVFGALFFAISQLPPHVTFIFYASMAFVFAFLLIRPRLKAMNGTLCEGSLVLMALPVLILSAALCLAKLTSLHMAFLCLIIAGFGWFWLRPTLMRMTAATASGAGKSPLGSFLSALLSTRYAITTKGLEDIIVEKRGTNAENTPRPLLFLPNHPALVDPLIVYSRIAGLKPRALSDEARMSGPVERFIVKALNIITIPDPVKEGRGTLGGVALGLNKITEALKQGDAILLYPAGRIYRSNDEHLGANSAVAHILNEVKDVRVILVRTTGVWGSSFSRAGGRSPSVMQNLFRHLPALFANLLFFSPRRKVTVEFNEVSNLPKEKMALNRFLEAYYNEKSHDPIYVPYGWWQGQASRPMPLAKPAAKRDSPASSLGIPSETAEQVNAILHSAVTREAPNSLQPDIPPRDSIAHDSIGHEPASHETKTRFEPTARLAEDLSLDSLGIMEVATRIETTFGNPIPKIDRLLTVEDCLLAAAGHLFEADETATAPPPKEWFGAIPHNCSSADQAPHKLTVPPQTKNIVDGFLRLVRQDPALPLLADRSGVKTRKDVLTAALALKGSFARLGGRRIGVMLPASPATTIVWLALQLAGKEPVMLNWTVGKTNFAHCVNQSETHYIITAKALLLQLATQGVELGHSNHFIHLEEVIGRMGIKEKAKAFLQATCFRLLGKGVSLKQVPDTAVILFTSGSEAAPKGVPLTQKNLVQNASDIIEALELPDNLRLLAMLPPFHSFGCVVGITLPLLAGVKAVFHPNPTESSALAALIRDYKVNLLGATPTFLESILKTPGPEDALTSLHYAFVGAEKCPDHLHTLFAQRCPEGSICEGYGITECSPVIAVNKPGEAVIGSIGAPLTSVECAIVHEENENYTSLPQGSTGLLLVRGPSIFSGYLNAEINPFVQFEGQQWYRTGDLVRQDEEGLLYFKGRLSRFVKIGGEMISLPQIESVLQRALEAHPTPAESNRLIQPNHAHDNAQPQQALKLSAELLADSSKEKTKGPTIAIEASQTEGERPRITAFTTRAVTTQELNILLKNAGLSPLSFVHTTIQLDQIPVLGTGKVDYQCLKKMMEKQQIAA